MLDGSVLETAEKLGNLEKKIEDPRFLRCHQSFLVNMDHITDVEEEFLLRNGERVPIRVRGRKDVLDAIITFQDKVIRQLKESNCQYGE